MVHHLPDCFLAKAGSSSFVYLRHMPYDAVSTSWPLLMEIAGAEKLISLHIVHSTHSTFKAGRAVCSCCLLRKGIAPAVQ